MKIAVLLFAYNRPKYLKKVIKTHKKIPGLSYYAFIDKSDKQKEIIEIIHNSGIYDIIIPRQEHLGAEVNILSGIDFVDCDAVIALEDDLMLMPDTLEYLIEQLKAYEHNTRIAAVASQKGTSPRQEGWGWAWGTWKKKWDVKFDGRTWDTSAVDYFKSYGLYAVFSPIKRVKHIGNKGTHFNYFSRFGIRRHLRRWGLL